MLCQRQGCSDSEEEEEWEDRVEDVARDVVGQFRGYLHEEEESEELRRVASSIITIRTQKGWSLDQVLVDQWRRSIGLTGGNR